MKGVNYCKTEFKYREALYVKSYNYKVKVTERNCSKFWRLTNEKWQLFKGLSWSNMVHSLFQWISRCFLLAIWIQSDSDVGRWDETFFKWILPSNSCPAVTLVQLNDVELFMVCHWNTSFRGGCKINKEYYNTFKIQLIVTWTVDVTAHI